MGMIRGSAQKKGVGAEFLKHCSWAILRLPVDALESPIFSLLCRQHLCPSVPKWNHGIFVICRRISQEAAMGK